MSYPGIIIIFIPNAVIGQHYIRTEADIRKFALGPSSSSLLKFRLDSDFTGLLVLHKPAAILVFL